VSGDPNLQKKVIPGLGEVTIQGPSSLHEDVARVLKHNHTRLGNGGISPPEVQGPVKVWTEKLGASVHLKVQRLEDDVAAQAIIQQ
jgi:hypothetical protein